VISPYLNNFDSNHFEVILPQSLLLIITFRFCLIFQVLKKHIFKTFLFDFFTEFVK